MTLVMLVGCTDSASEGSGSAAIGVSITALSTGEIARVQVTISGDHIDPVISFEHRWHVPDSGFAPPCEATSLSPTPCQYRRGGFSLTVERIFQ